MRVDFIIKIAIYIIIVLIIMSKANKKKKKTFKNTNNFDLKMFNRQGEQRKTNNKFNNFKHEIYESKKIVSPNERVKQREKELENRNKK